MIFIMYIVYSDEIHMKVQEPILRTLIAQICFHYQLYKNFISAKLKNSGSVTVFKLHCTV